jgi:hypothetical protein
VIVFVDISEVGVCEHSCWMFLGELYWDVIPKIAVVLCQSHCELAQQGCRRMTLKVYGLEGQEAQSLKEGVYNAVASNMRNHIENLYPSNVAMLTLYLFW